MKRDEFGFVLPNLYYQFLTDWKEIDPYEIGDTGICLYAKEGQRSVMRLIRLRK